MHSPHSVNKFPFNFKAIPDAAFHSPDLDAYDKIVLGFLISMGWGQKRTSPDKLTIYVTQTYIAKSTGCSRDRIGKALNRLCGSRPLREKRKCGNPKVFDPAIIENMEVDGVARIYLRSGIIDITPCRGRFGTICNKIEVNLKHDLILRYVTYADSLDNSDSPSPVGDVVEFPEPLVMPTGGAVMTTQGDVVPAAVTQADVVRQGNEVNATGSDVTHAEAAVVAPENAVAPAQYIPYREQNKDLSKEQNRDLRNTELTELDAFENELIEKMRKEDPVAYEKYCSGKGIQS